MSKIKSDPQYNALQKVCSSGSKDCMEMDETEMEDTSRQQQKSLIQHLVDMNNEDVGMDPVDQTQNMIEAPTTSMQRIKREYYIMSHEQDFPQTPF